MSSDPQAQGHRGVRPLRMPQPGATIGRYTVDAILGEGGMAVVYRVTHDRLRSQHATKLLKIRHPLIEERFLREGRLQANLRHPNIVAVHDVLEFDGRTALVMEYIDGNSLADWLAGGPPPPLDSSLAVFRGMVGGIAHAHAQGLVHRDLKPANVMLQRVGRDLVAKVMDFGIAKELSNPTDDGMHGSHTRTGISMGTPDYMAPEQVRDAKTVDQRADVFSLGCILYEMITGKRPFDSDDIITTYGKAASGDYERPDTLRDPLPQEVLRAVTWALEPDRARRLPDCSTLIAVLDGNMSPPDTPTSYVGTPEMSPRGPAHGPTAIPLPVILNEDASLDPHPAPVFVELDRPPRRRWPRRLVSAVLGGLLGAVMVAWAAKILLEEPTHQIVPVTGPERVVEPAPSPAPSVPEPTPPAPPPAEKKAEPPPAAAPAPSPVPASAARRVAGLWVGSVTLDIARVGGRSLRATLDDGGARTTLAGEVSEDGARIVLRGVSDATSFMGIVVPNRRGGLNIEGDLRRTAAGAAEPVVVVKQ